MGEAGHGGGVFASPPRAGGSPGFPLTWAGVGAGPWLSVPESTRGIVSRFRSHEAASSCTSAGGSRTLEVSSCPPVLQRQVRVGRGAKETQELPPGRFSGREAHGGLPPPLLSSACSRGWFTPCLEFLGCSEGGGRNTHLSQLPSSVSEAPWVQLGKRQAGLGLRLLEGGRTAQSRWTGVWGAGRGLPHTD